MIEALKLLRALHQEKLVPPNITAMTQNDLIGAMQQDQAAYIDGASDVMILLHIILPLSAQGLVAASVFIVVYAWNEYLFAFIFTTSRAKTAPLLLSEMMSSLTGVDWGVLFAAVTVQLVPILLFVVLVQRFLISGLTSGALKG